MKAAEGAPSAVSDCGIEDYADMKPPALFVGFFVQNVKLGNIKIVAAIVSSTGRRVDVVLAVLG